MGALGTDTSGIKVALSPLEEHDTLKIGKTFPTTDLGRGDQREADFLRQADASGKSVPSVC